VAGPASICITGTPVSLSPAAGGCPWPDPAPGGTGYPATALHHQPRHAAATNPRAEAHTARPTSRRPRARRYPAATPPPHSRDPGPVRRPYGGPCVLLSPTLASPRRNAVAGYPPPPGAGSGHRQPPPAGPAAAPPVRPGPRVRAGSAADTPAAHAAPPVA